MNLIELKGVKQHLTYGDSMFAVGRKLEDMGFTQLGSGASASVWHIPKKPYVLKLFDSDDHAYADFVEMVKRSNFNPHFPMFRGATIKLTPEVSAIRMERLKPMQMNWASALNRGIRVIMEAVTLGSDWLEQMSDEFSDREKKDVQIALRKWPRLTEATDQLIQLYKSSDHAHWDLHSDNVMMRGSVPVFTDPFSV